MKIQKNLAYKFLILIIIISAVVGSLTTYAILKSSPSSEELVAEFYWGKILMIEQTIKWDGKKSR